MEIKEGDQIIVGKTKRIAQIIDGVLCAVTYDYGQEEPRYSTLLEYLRFVKDCGYKAKIRIVKSDWSKLQRIEKRQQNVWYNWQDKIMKNRNLKNSDNWKTPDSLYNELNTEFNFDFDPCPLNIGVVTPDNDGLLVEWGLKNFVNPPYSLKLKTAFVKKAVEFKNKRRVCVLLLPVSTSTKLFHDIILPNANEIRFIKGRVKFEGINTFGKMVSNKCGMHDSMIVVFDGRKGSDTKQLAAKINE
jgi:phage N-6-adenine-methyltransferase